MDTITQLVLLSLAAGTPLVFAALGELVVEKSGVLNLGVEGMMLVGAIASFIVAAHTQSPWLGVAAGALAAAALSVIFAVVALSLRANQVATGLALSLFGVGLSAFIGREYSSVVIEGITPVSMPALSGIPVVGRLLFGHNPLVYLSLALFAGVQWFLYHTRAGLVLRAVGESPQSANAIGYPVIAIRYAAVVFGGACAGLGGAYLAMAYTPSWVEGMTAGRGWIALALVVFATWKPSRVDDRRLPVRQRHPRAVPGAGRRCRHTVPAAGDAAVCGDDRRARDHLARRDNDPAQCAGVPRQALPPGVVAQRERQIVASR